MAVARWTSDFTLTSYLGSLSIPAEMLVAEACAAGVDLRTQTTALPSDDGNTLRQRFKGGYQMHLVLQLLADGVVLFDADLQTFYDELMRHLDALEEYDGRISWEVPGGGDDRMIDNIRTLERPGPAGALFKQFSFAVESPFPYAMDASQTTTELTDGTPVTVTRVGSAKAFKPVAHITGPVTGAVTIKNNTLGLEFPIDVTLPGASALASGDFYEIDFFRKKITYGHTGGPADLDFVDEVVDWPNADWWPLVPGANVVELVGASGSMLWNEAWA